LDTRNKIRTLEAFVAARTADAWTAASGVFDPFTVQLARHIASLSAGRKLLVIIDDSAGYAFLSPEARAQMLASLRAVDAVIIGSPKAVREMLLNSNIDIRIVEDPAADQQRSAQFVQYVLDRQASSDLQKT
jgi:glycerol-3-phosphate cytidylyltransferase-like family protein